MAEPKKKLIDYEKLLQKNHNKGLVILIVVIVIGYVFFFLSPLLFHEKPTKELSNINQDIAFLNGKIRINSWEYSKSQQVCEICCTTYGVNPDSFDIQASCNFTYKTKGSKALPAMIGYKQSDYFVIYVVDIPEDWYCISLRATRVARSTADEANSSQDDTQNYGYIFTCVDDVEQVPEIQNNKTKETIIIERDQRIIEYDEALIKENDNEIENLKAQIETWESDIDDIERERPFQTSSEKKESDSRINTLKGYITQNDRKIETIQLKNSDLKKEIRDYESLIRKLSQN